MLHRIVVFSVSVIIAAVYVSYTAHADTIAGTWRGDGLTDGADGSSEKVRCQIAIELERADTYVVSGKCSSTKGNTSASGEVEKSSANSYLGWMKADSSVGSGRTMIVLRDNVMSVQILGNKGSLKASLRRRSSD